MYVSLLRAWLRERFSRSRTFDNHFLLDVRRSKGVPNSLEGRRTSYFIFILVDDGPGCIYYLSELIIGFYSPLRASLEGHA